MPKASSLHALKLTSSMIVGVMISFPGNVPHVTAFVPTPKPDSLAEDSKLPAAFMARKDTDSFPRRRLRREAQEAEGKNSSTKAFWKTNPLRGPQPKIGFEE